MLIRPGTQSFGFGFPLSGRPNSPPIVDTGGGGGGDVPEAPEGSAYIINADGEYLINADDAYILAKA